MKKVVWGLIYFLTLNNTLIAASMEDSIQTAINDNISEKIARVFPNTKNFDYECRDASYTAKYCRVTTDEGNSVTFYCEFSPGLFASTATCVGIR